MFPVSLAVAVEGRVKKPNLTAVCLAELLESCFPLWLCHRETRAGQRGGKKTPKTGNIERARSRGGTALFLAMPPPLKAQPAVSRGKCEALVDGYNHPLKPWQCVLFLFLFGPLVQ